MGTETSLGADLASCEQTIDDLGWLAGTLDDTARTTRRVLDGSGAWCHAYENTVADLGGRATASAEDVRGVAASLGLLVERLREVDAVLARARTAADARGLLSGTLVVEPEPTAGAEAWADYGTIVGTLAEARRRQGEAGTAWLAALWRFEVGDSPAPPPAAPVPLVVAPDRWPPPVGDLPGERVAPTAPTRPRPEPGRPEPGRPDPVPTTRHPDPTPDVPPLRDERPPRTGMPEHTEHTGPRERADRPGRSTTTVLSSCSATFEPALAAAQPVTWPFRLGFSATSPGPGSWTDLLRTATGEATPPDDA